MISRCRTIVPSTGLAASSFLRISSSKVSTSFGEPRTAMRSGRIAGASALRDFGGVLCLSSQEHCIWIVKSRSLHAAFTAFTAAVKGPYKACSVAVSQLWTGWQDGPHPYSLPPSPRTRRAWLEWNWFRILAIPDKCVRKMHHLVFKLFSVCGMRIKVSCMCMVHHIAGVYVQFELLAMEPAGSSLYAGETTLAV